MKAIDYLRAMAKRNRPPATDGLVTTDHEPIVMPAGYLMPASVPPPAEATPSGFIEFSGTLSEADVERIRQQFQTMPRVRASRSEPMRCPCVAIYSECRRAGPCTQ